ncbi:hypothetical protein JCM17961_05650 [Endothiovibrio diazotrophicus]
MWLLLLFSASSAVAEPVGLSMPNGRVALADYRSGDADRPAVLLLHGFLQTHHFGIIQSLADELSDAGYPVLAPTLTLGIDQRRESLPCDAIQNHRLGDGDGELASWVGWLHLAGHRQVVVAGHSSGALRALRFAAARPHAVRGLVLISMGHFGGWEYPDFTPGERSQAREWAAAGRKGLGQYHLSFCDGNYLAPPDAYLSYIEEDAARLEAELDRLDVPATLIFGGADRQLAPGWIDRVSAAGGQVRLIPGAGHFFSGGYEFDLHEALLGALAALPRRSAGEGP